MVLGHGVSTTGRAPGVGVSPPSLKSEPRITVLGEPDATVTWTLSLTMLLPAGSSKSKRFAGPKVSGTTHSYCSILVLKLLLSEMNQSPLASLPQVGRLTCADATTGSTRLAPASRPHTPRQHRNRLMTTLPHSQTYRVENRRRIPNSTGSAAPRSSPVAGSGTSLFVGVSLRMSSLTVGERSTSAPSQLSIPVAGNILFPPRIIPLRTEHGCS